MLEVGHILLIVSIFLISGIFSSKFSSKVGIPGLVLFLVVGVLAGPEGLARISVTNYGYVHAVGILSLTLILFDGGLQTSRTAFQHVWKPAFTLATGGVVITAAVVGVAAHVLLNLPWLESLLLGSIIGSTDAAAIFTVIRSKGVGVKEKLVSTLEIESGLNDPMAVFLTVTLISLIQKTENLGWHLAGEFLLQMGLGVVIGALLGKLLVRTLNWISLDNYGLYLVMTTAWAFLSYGLADSLGGSGFLAVYISGYLVGNSKVVFRRGISLFHDGLAWSCQILMFVVLGLVAVPSQLIKVAFPAFIIGLVVIFAARPLGVVASLLPFKFTKKEMVFVSWGGLKGAVPIVLATYPLILGLEYAPLLFNVVFFIVVVSAFLQGSTFVPLSRKLGVDMPTKRFAPVYLEMTSFKEIDGEIMEYTIAQGSKVGGRKLYSLSLPEGVVVALIAREERIILPQGSTILEEGDHIFVIADSRVEPLLTYLFGTPTRDTELSRVEFTLKGSTLVQEIEDLYGIFIPTEPELTLDEVLRIHSLEKPLEQGDLLAFDGVALIAQSVDEQGSELVIIRVQ